MPRSPLCTNRTRTGLRLCPHRWPQTQDTVCGQYSRPINFTFPSQTLACGMKRKWLGCFSSGHSLFLKMLTFRHLASSEQWGRTGSGDTEKAEKEKNLARFQGVQKEKTQPDGKQRAKVEREAAGLLKKMTKWEKRGEKTRLKYKVTEDEWINKTTVWENQFHHHGSCKNKPLIA